MSFICSIIASYYALKSEKVDGKSIKCLRYIIDGDEGARDWFANESLKKRNEFQKWHSKLMKKAYNNFGEATNYYCLLVGIHALIFPFIPFLSLAINLFLIIKFLCK